MRLALVIAVLASTVACSGSREGFALVPEGTATATQLEDARDQLQDRLDVMPPDARVSIRDEALYVEMPINEATPMFVDRLTARGEMPGTPSTTTSRCSISSSVPAEARVFAAHTTDHVGDVIALTVDGVVFSAPIIEAPIPDGRIRISAGVEGGDDLAWIARAIQSGILEIELTGGPYSGG